MACHMLHIHGHGHCHGHGRDLLYLCTSLGSRPQARNGASAGSAAVLWERGRASAGGAAFRWKAFKRSRASAGSAALRCGLGVKPLSSGWLWNQFGTICSCFKGR